MQLSSIPPQSRRSSNLKDKVILKVIKTPQCTSKCQKTNLALLKTFKQKLSSLLIYNFKREESMSNSVEVDLASVIYIQ